MKMSSSTKLGLTLLLLTIPLLSRGQSTKEIIGDAWIYPDSWTNYSKSDTLNLVISWNTPIICVVSFEKGLYSASDEYGETKEKGKWEIKRVDKQNFIIIKADSGQTIKFEILSVNNQNIKLRRVTPVG